MSAAVVVGLCYYGNLVVLFLRVLRESLPTLEYVECSLYRWVVCIEILCPRILVKNIVNDVVHTYTMEEIKTDPERAEKEILEKLQGFFDSNVVVDVGFIQVTSE